MRVRVVACAAMTAAAFAAPAADAATLTVNSTFDETNAGDGSCSLREAILAVDSPGSANGDCSPAAFGANTIVLKADRYFLGSASAPHTPLQIASTVTSLTIVGAGASQTTIDAIGLGDRAFAVASGANVTIRNLTVTGGHAPDGTVGAAGNGTAGGAGGAGANGGGILNQGALTLSDSAVVNSQAGNGGGGGSGGGPASDPAFGGGDGGSGGEGGGIFNTGTLTLAGATIARDTSGAGGSGAIGGQESTTNPGGTGGAGGAGGNGAGIANEGGTVTIAGSAIRGNTGGAGGAGGTGGGSNSGGSGTGGPGGAGGAGSSGGGVWSAHGSLSVTNSTVASDTTGDGGSGGNGGLGTGAGSTGGHGATGGDSGSGGGIAASGSPGPKLLNGTVVGNKVGQPGTAGSGGTGAATGAAGTAGATGAGGGLAGMASGVLTVENSLLALNGGSNCGPSAVTDGGHNLGFGDPTCPASFATGDPNLGPLQDNGGPSWTVSLQVGSAAVDQIPAAGADCPATDQRGVARPAGAKCDIGAFEAAGPRANTGAATAVGRTSATLNGSATPNSGLASVRFSYGGTTKYGSNTPAKLITGVAPTAITATIRGLRPHTTYHYRLVATTSGGTVQGADRTFTTSVAPKLTRLTVKPSTFRAGRGTKISYTDTKAATTKFVVLRLVRHRRPSRVARFSHRDKAGRNSLRFAGRGLKPGNYRLQATPGLRGQAGSTVTVTFRITR